MGSVGSVVPPPPWWAKGGGFPGDAADQKKQRLERLIEQIMKTIRRCKKELGIPPYEFTPTPTITVDNPLGVPLPSFYVWRLRWCLEDAEKQLKEARHLLDGPDEPSDDEIRWQEHCANFNEERRRNAE